MNQICNPYLPSYEYIPDGEPHVFGDRVYVYGSHDRFNGPIFCLNDYVCYSAPVEDLSDWRYEGVIYEKKQDPKNKLGLRLLFAPDVCQGVDGRYYLYYALDFVGMMGVAVSDKPAGPFEFYGYVKDSKGKIWGRRKGDQLPFDPAILVDDDGRVFLYSGFYRGVPAIASRFHKLRTDGGVVIELEQDMVTMKSEPKLIFPKEGEGSFRNHEFFEASSIRKDGDRYLFVYSSRHNHELCYAVSDRPDGGFHFGGTLVDIGDVFLEEQGRKVDCLPEEKDSHLSECKATILTQEAMDRKEKSARNYLGNTHGGLLKLGNQWYIFYHRQTNRHSYSRQACAEKLVETEEGRFLQAEVTSCGLNPGPLKAEGIYEAYTACNLWSAEGVGRYDCKNPRRKFAKHPYFTQSGKDRENKGDQYIANMRNHAVAGFKYFDFGEKPEKYQIGLKLGGDIQGTMGVYLDPECKELLTSIELSGFTNIETRAISGVHALYFRYEGEGYVDFHAFCIAK